MSTWQSERRGHDPDFERAVIDARAAVDSFEGWKDRPSDSAICSAVSCAAEVIGAVAGAI